MDEFMKQKIKRNFLFWGEMGQKYTLLMIIGAYAYSILELSGDALNMFMMMAVLASVIVPITFIQAYFTTVISLGSGRKETVLGSQLLYVIHIVEFTAATWLAGFVFPTQREFITETVYEQVWLMLGLVGIGQSIAAICLQNKSKQKTISLIVLATIAFVGMVGGVLIGSKDFISLIANRTAFQIGLTIGAIVIYAISIVVFIKCTKHYEAFRA